MALRYGIGVGRQGFTWTGVETIVRKAEWPDWIPPAQMVARQPYLPRWVGGGPGNPLGARALYLGNTEYRIHGTNDPSTIGKHVSSGCIRLQNADIIDLYSRVGVGTKVVVLPNDQRRALLDDDQRTAPQGAPTAARMSAQIGVQPAGQSHELVSRALLIERNGNNPGAAHDSGAYPDGTAPFQPCRKSRSNSGGAASETLTAWTGPKLSSGRNSVRNIGRRKTKRKTKR
jgi:hypothetical protein